MSSSNATRFKGAWRSRPEPRSTRPFALFTTLNTPACLVRFLYSRRASARYARLSVSFLGSTVTADHDCERDPFIYQAATDRVKMGTRMRPPSSEVRELGGPRRGGPAEVSGGLNGGWSANVNKKYQA